MYWNFRLAYKKDGEDTLWGIVEAYYNEQGEVTYTTENFVDCNNFECPGDVMDSLEAMREACDKDPLDLDNLVYAKDES